VAAKDTFWVTVTDEEITSSPISPILCGNFIELGYGVQVEGMWAEMLFNRSFEPFYPYNAGTKDWFGLFNDSGNTSKGYKADWSGEDWYHSGYEHNPWFAAPGDPGPLLIHDHATFFVNSSLLTEVTLELVSDSVVHGCTALKITNRERLRWAGVAQRGVRIRPDTYYRFAGWARTEGDACEAEIRLYARNNWDHAVLSIPLGLIGTEYQKYELEFSSGKLSGNYTFAYFVNPGSSVVVDAFTLMPTDAIDGWRFDVVEAVHSLNPSVIRFPGGCFASFYDWRDGIGPFTQRKPQPSYFWGGLNYNDVGSAECASLCKAVGAEMMFCVNMFHPKKEKYCGPEHVFPFTDQSAGIGLAVDWLAYCNLPATHPMGALRASHGYLEPFGVKYWEMDNETARWFGAEEYAHTIVEYSTALKGVDPTVQIGMMVYDRAYKEMLPEMLAICGMHIDFVADRGGGEKDVEPTLAVLRHYNRASRTSIRYCNTEWLPDDFNTPAFEALIPDSRPRTFRFNKWRYALNMIPVITTWQRKGGEVLFFNFNNLANTHGQSAVETAKEAVYLNAAGRVLELISRSPSAWPLKLKGYDHDEYADIQLHAAWDLSRERLVLYLWNVTGGVADVSFELACLNRRFKSAQVSMLAAHSLLSFNSPESQNEIRRRDSVQDLHDCAVYETAVPAYSFVEVVLG